MDLYYIDLEGFSLERLKRSFESGEVLPGRLILRENIDARFEILAATQLR